jgi:hypothetical protein
MYEEKYGEMKQNSNLTELNYCIHPLVLKEQLTQSLENLGIEQLDCYYLNLPEVLLNSLSKEEFMEELMMAFEYLESEVKTGRIRSYGITCWNIGRQLPSSPFYFNFNEIMTTTKDKFGPNHNFRFTQIPLSIGMPENYCEKFTTSPSTNGISLIN